MTSLKNALRTTAPIALGVALMTGLMLLIYALAGHFRSSVLGAVFWVCCLPSVTFS